VRSLRIVPVDVAEARQSLRRVAAEGAVLEPVLHRLRADDLSGSQLKAAISAMLTVALRLKHDPHWHTYWQVPGDSGLPTTIKWALPEGWSAGPIQWPVPQRLAAGPLMNFGYEGEILLLTRLTPPANVKPGDTVTLQARADWLICKDVCIPESGSFALEVPARAATVARDILYHQD
jgi:thiol:disulfide interchange protein DsbD